MKKPMLEKLTKWYENHSKPYDQKAGEGCDNVKICVGYHREIDEKVNELYDFPRGTLNLLSVIGETFYSWEYIPKGYYKGKEYIPFE